SGADVTRLRRVLVGLDGGLAAYPLADPTIAADVNHTGSLDSGDVTQVRRAIIGLATPNLPPAGPPNPGTSGADPELFLPTDLSGQPGETLTVQVMMRVTE